MREREQSIERCLAQAWRSTPERVKGWVPGDRLRAALGKQVAEAVDRARSGWTPPQVREAVQIPNTAPEDYAYKTLALRNGGAFVAGIRFKGGDFSARFVEVYAREHPVEDRRTLVEMGDAAREAFAVFSPTRMRVQVSVGGAEDRALSGPGVTTDYLTLAGRIRDLRRTARPPHTERVRLEIPRSVDLLYDRYGQAYGSVHADRPELAGLVDPMPPEEVKRYVGGGSFYEACVDDLWAGVICAEAKPFYGANGYEIIEEILASPFRGKGLAPALQRRLIDALPTDENAILHGTIDAVNAPSLATARRVGRVAVTVSRFVDL